MTVVLGASLGLLIGHRLPERIQESIIIGLGLVTVFVGLDNAAQTTNIIIPMLSLMIGVIIGEWLDIDSALQRLATWLQARVESRSSASADDLPVQGERQRFVTGFVTASLVFCVGPLTILGSIQDGMGLPAGFEQLAIKSTLDGFAAIAFAATFGVGVLFTAFTVFFFQGALALGGSIAGQFMTAAMIAEMVSTGGLILLGLALVILELKPVRVANFLPALVVAPLIVLILSLF